MLFHLFMHSLVASCTCPDRPDKDRTCKLGTSGRCSNQLSELAGSWQEGFFKEMTLLQTAGALVPSLHQAHVLGPRGIS